MIDSTLLSVTEHGEIPSMALAASRRSSRLAEDVLLFLLLGGRPMPVEEVIEYAAFAMSMIDGFFFSPLASAGNDTANILVVF
jgi:hypothetical protein